MGTRAGLFAILLLLCSADVHITLFDADFICCIFLLLFGSDLEVRDRLIPFVFVLLQADLRMIRYYADFLLCCCCYCCCPCFKVFGSDVDETGDDLVLSVLNEGEDVVLSSNFVTEAIIDREVVSGLLSIRLHTHVLNSYFEVGYSTTPRTPEALFNSSIPVYPTSCKYRTSSLSLFLLFGIIIYFEVTITAINKCL